MKKIDVKKSVVYNKVINKFDGLYLGQIGYFSDSYCFASYETNKLSDINTSSEFRYRTPTGDKFTYFIPADKVVFEEEPKKYRPYKYIEEFIKTTGCAIGDVITFKRKNNNTEYNMLFNGYLVKDSAYLIYLGAKYYVFDELLNDYLYYIDGEWHPFGVEE